MLEVVHVGGFSFDNWHLPPRPIPHAPRYRDLGFLNGLTLKIPPQSDLMRDVIDHYQRKRDYPGSRTGTTRLGSAPAARYVEY